MGERGRLLIIQVSSEYWSVLAFEENTWGWREIYPDGLQRGLGAHIGPGIVFILTSWETSSFTGTVQLVEYSERFYVSSGTWLVLDWVLLRMRLKNHINKLKKKNPRKRIQRNQNKNYVQDFVYLLMWEIDPIIFLVMPLLRVILGA